MAMNKIVKLQSEQSGVFTAAKNLIDFTIPSYGSTQYDMRNAYVNLVLRTTITDSDPASGSGIYNFDFVWNGDQSVTFENNALIKNVRLTSSRVGGLEDIRNQHYLRAAVAPYKMSEDDWRGKEYKRLNQASSQGNIRLAPNQDFRPTGSVKSRYRDINAQIPLKDFLELGNADTFPCDKLGDCRLHLECNFDKLTIQQLQGTGTRTSDFGNTLYTDFEDTATGVNVTELTMKEPLKDIKASPYWVGQKLVFDLSGNGVASATPTAVVNEISYSESTQKLTLGFASSIADASGNSTFSSITCDGVDAGSLEYSITEAQLILEQKGKNEPMNELEYKTYTNEADVGAGLTSFTRQYQVEPNCFNLLCVVGTDDTDLLPENENKTRFTNYRIRSDNKDLTNRRVEYQTPLYYDRTGMWMLNEGLPLKNLIEVNIDANTGYDARYSNPKDLIFIGTNLPMTPTPKLVQLSIEGGGDGVKQINLYKSVVKSIKL
ncbi:MAG: hypothetical protein ACR2M9_03975 [Cyanophyceae cyanobacterium]